MILITDKRVTLTVILPALITLPGEIFTNRNIQTMEGDTIQTEEKYRKRE